MKVLSFFFSVMILSCTSQRMSMLPATYPDFLKEGHRGARGHVPENTIASMIKGIELGANVLEVDVYITKDGQVLVAHDPYLNRAISTVPGVDDLSAEQAKTYVWHQMNYEDIRKIDVGSKGNPSFPKQVKQPAYMPLLGELIDSVEQFTSGSDRSPIIYNIEIKSNPKFDSVYQPSAAVIVKKVMDVVRSKNIGNRFYLQSFDKRQIIEVHTTYPDVVTAYLVDSKTLSVEDNLKELGYVPEIYSPHFSLVNSQTVEDCKKSKMKLVPWTVNTRVAVDTLVGLGVDGIITDYPELVADVK